MSARGVRLHRTADVEQENEPPVAGARLLEVASDRFAARPHRRTHRASEIGPIGSTIRRGEPERAARRPDEPESAHQLLSLDELVGAVLGEVLLAQHLGGAEPQLDHRIVAAVGLIRAGVGIVTLVVHRRGDLERLVLDERIGIRRSRVPRTPGRHGRRRRDPRADARGWSGRPSRSSRDRRAP